MSKGPEKNFPICKELIVKNEGHYCSARFDLVVQFYEFLSFQCLSEICVVF